MADRLTQLQDCLDQLATQFYASIRYISTQHPPSALPSQPPIRPPSPALPTTTTTTTTVTKNNNTTSNPGQPSNNPPTTSTTTPSFPAAQAELAHDLLIKTEQIAYLISVLPGIENSAAEQESRIAALETELRDSEEERVCAVREMEGWRVALEGVLGGARR